MSSPCTEDMVLYSAVHALRHSYRRLNWFIDLQLLICKEVDAGQLLERAQATALERPLLYALRFLERYVEVPSVLHDWVGRQQLGAVEFWLVQRVWADRRQGELGDVLWSFSIGGSLRRLFLFAADLVSSTGGVDAGISLPSRIAIPAGLCIAFGATAAARWAAVAQYGEKNIR